MSDATKAELVCYECRSSREVECTPENRLTPGETHRYTCAECRLEERKKRFHELCPPLYLETDPTKLPMVEFEKVMAWEYGPKGLIISGDTGKGKTRCAWLLMKKVILSKNLQFRVKAFDCVSFGRELASRYRAETAEYWLDELGKIDIVFFDDLGKFKLTERVEAELFGIVEQRCANMKPIIATTNDDGESLVARMTDGRGSPLIRRLREFCDIVTFG